MVRQARAQAVGLAAMALAGLAIAGCQTNPLEVTRTSCPAVAVVKHTGTLTRFNPGAEANADQIQLNASIGGLSRQCTERGGTVTTTLSYQITVTRPAKGPALSVAVPVFQVVMRDGSTLLAKDVSTVMLVFPEGVDRIQVSQSLQASTPPLPPPPKPDPDNPDAPPPRGTYEVLVGFQLTEAEAAYNAAK